MSGDVKVPIAQCPAETGWPPVRTRWVDANRGDLYNPKVFSGLVTREVAMGQIPEFFAARPQIENIDGWLCCASSQWATKPTRLIICNVKKAFFYAPATKMVFVALPATI